MFYLFAGTEARFSSLIEFTAANLRGPHASYLVEGPTATSEELHHSLILHDNDLNYLSCLPINQNTNEHNKKIVYCSEFFSTKRHDLSLMREVSWTELNLLYLFVVLMTNDKCRHCHIWSFTSLAFVYSWMKL
jgi:hypothetical protein